MNNKKARDITDNINKFLQGKNNAAELSVICLLAGGHLLIEDVPGVGKTTLANLIARSAGCGFSRIQFTPDTLPGDVTGSTVYNMKTGGFEYVEGAVMENIVLVDEINRTSPKTQAALLEAMQERQVTVDRKTYPLPVPFMVIATQNPIDFLGTYNLPEAQLDRFLMKLSLGYPSSEDEQKMAESFLSGARVSDICAVTDKTELTAIQEEVSNVKAHPDIIQYVINLVTLTRENKLLTLGGSPRATLALLSASQGCAYLNGRDYVIPDDVQYVLPYVLCHRIILTVEARMNGQTPEKIIEDIRRTAKVPVL